MLGRRDAVRQRPGEGVCERRGRHEDALPRAELVAEVEEGEQVGDAGPVARFEETHEEAQRHHAAPILRRGLERCDESPSTVSFFFFFELKAKEKRTYQPKTQKAAHLCGGIIFHMMAWNSKTMYEM